MVNMADNYDDYSREELLRELRLRDRRPRFGLVWERKEIEHEKAVNDDFVTLDFDPALSCGDAPYRNLIIEGDNFDALRYLRMTHAGKINCIYIDPPYNTGSRDFIYNDRFVDKEDSYRHSKWLEFMYRRLQQARELLAEDGVIFVSIDDNEQANLKLLLDSVFGEPNFVSTIVWEKRYSPQNAVKWFSESHDFVIVYAKNKTNWYPNLLERSDEMNARYRNLDNDARGVWKSVDSTAQAGHGTASQFYILTAPNGKQHTLPNGRCWLYTEPVFQKMVADNRIWFGTNGNNVPAIKRFLSEVKQGTACQTIWKYADVGHNQEAKKEVNDLFPESSVFDTPKPLRLIKRILQLATNKNSIILDFFAGSGTTAHAIEKLNAEDGGNRRFILVSSTEATTDEPDKNLCRDVCAERVRRVMQGYTNKKGEAVTGLGGSFAYLRSHRHPAETLFNSIQHEAIWTALCLTHTETVSPYNADALVQQLELETANVLYLPKINETVLEALTTALATDSTLLIYSWQPGLLRQHFEDERVSFLPIPQFLVDRFGNK